MQRLWGLICDRGKGGKLFQPVLVPQTEDYDVSTEKCYVKFMLPKRPKNYTKFATNFFNMGLPRPPAPFEQCSTKTADLERDGFPQ